jgi:uncharacterized protein (DUF433 family)
MERKDLLRRITVNPAIFGGKPIVRGMRIPVDLIFALLAEGETVESVLDAYPDLSGMTCGPALPLRTLSSPTRAWRPSSWYPLEVPGRCLRAAAGA